LFEVNPLLDQSPCHVILETNAYLTSGHRSDVTVTASPFLSLKKYGPTIPNADTRHHTVPYDCGEVSHAIDEDYCHSSIACFAYLHSLTVQNGLRLTSFDE
jgi:hypothetical protein